jgi:hypothetical protein
MSKNNQKAHIFIEWDRDVVRVHFADSSLVREAANLNGIDGIDGKNAVVLISRRSILHRAITLPDASRADTIAALKVRLSDVFPIPSSELAFDFVSGDKTSGGRKSDVYAVRNIDVKAVVEMCNEHNISILQIIPAQVLIPSIIQKQNLVNGILVERFGDMANIDVVKEGTLDGSKTVTLAQIDQEIARFRQMFTGNSSLFTYGLSIDGSEQTLSASHVLASKDASFTINLEPEEYRVAKVEKDRKADHRKAYLVIAAAAALSALNINDYSNKSIAYSQSENKLKAILKQSADRAARVESDLGKVEPQAKQLKIAFQPAQKVSDIMKAASLLVPKGAWLTGLSVDRGKSLQIRGAAKDSNFVANYLSELTKQKRFRDVQLKFTSAGEIDGTNVVLFNISAFPVGNLPVIETTKKRK